MIDWTEDELKRIGNADELQIQTTRLDGTLRKPVTIWTVRVGRELFIRSYRGRASSWFRGALKNNHGRIQAGGVSKAVTFNEVSDPGINDQIDTAYKTKYGRMGAAYVNTMVSADIRAATIKIIPL